MNIKCLFGHKYTKRTQAYADIFIKSMTFDSNSVDVDVVVSVDIETIPCCTRSGCGRHGTMKSKEFTTLELNFRLNPTKVAKVFEENPSMDGKDFFNYLFLGSHRRLWEQDFLNTLYGETAKKTVKEFALWYSKTTLTYNTSCNNDLTIYAIGSPTLRAITQAALKSFTQRFNPDR